MSKAILVMDMPKCCDECSLHYERDCEDYCDIGNEYIDINVLKSKPNWCPLQPMPEYLSSEVGLTEFQMGARSGYNLCIDDILKGSEEE